VEPYQGQNFFSVNSNSTVTGFFFDSNTSQLSFTVSGNTGTTGYVNVNIPKSLVNDASTLKVCLDDAQIDYSCESQGDSWVLYFTYNHSSHVVDISLDSNSELTAVGELSLDVVTVLTLMAVLAVVIGGLVLYRKRTSVQ